MTLKFYLVGDNVDNWKKYFDKKFKTDKLGHVDYTTTSLTEISRQKQFLQPEVFKDYSKKYKKQIREANIYLCYISDTSELVPIMVEMGSIINGLSANKRLVICFENEQLFEQFSFLKPEGHYEVLLSNGNVLETFKNYLNL